MAETEFLTGYGLAVTKIEAEMAGKLSSNDNKAFVFAKLPNILTSKLLSFNKRGANEKIFDSSSLLLFYVVRF